MTASLRSTPGVSCALAAFVLLFLAGCASDQPEHRGHDEGRRHLPPPPPLAGSETFFNGGIVAELQTGAGFAAAGDEAKPDSGGNQGGGRGHGGFRMGGGGGGGGGGGRHGGGGRGGGAPADDASVDDSIEQDQIMNMRRAAANSSPPITIHLRFTNHGTSHADLQITDFLSELGNFVVQPEQLSLDPGQSAEVEPMTSRLAGEVNQSTITLTLALNGHSEQKVIALHLVPAPPPVPPADATQNPAAPPPSSASPPPDHP